MPAISKPWDSGIKGDEASTTFDREKIVAELEAIRERWPLGTPMPLSIRTTPASTTW